MERTTALAAMRLVAQKRLAAKKFARQGAGPVTTRCGNAGGTRRSASRCSCHCSRTASCSSASRLPRSQSLSARRRSQTSKLCSLRNSPEGSHTGLESAQGRNSPGVRRESGVGSRQRSLPNRRRHLLHVFALDLLTINKNGMLYIREQTALFVLKSLYHLIKSTELPILIFIMSAFSFFSCNFSDSFRFLTPFVF